MHFVLRGLTAQDDQGILITDLTENIPNLKNKTTETFSDKKTKDSRTMGY